MQIKRAVLIILASVVLVASCAAAPQSGSGKRFDHIVVVFEENKSASQVRNLPYISELRAAGVEFPQSFALFRPSEPNYIGFFSGSQHGVTTDGDYDIPGPNLYTRLEDRGFAFLSFAESLPSVGFRGTTYGKYCRKHNPAASFTSVPDSVNRPFTDFPSDEAGFAALPSISFVIPNLDDDMHDGSPAAADLWLRANIGPYARWAAANRSLLIVTFDEPDGAADLATTPILTIFSGAGLTGGTTVAQRVTHYTFLKFLLDEFGAAALGYDAGEAEVVF